MTATLTLETPNPPRERARGQSPRRADIQALRAIAVLLVVVYHSGLPLPGGFIGVDVFFTISGYVITQLLLRELHSDGRIALARFYVRRCRRLLPALSVMLIVTAIASALIQSPLGAQQDTAANGLGAATWSSNGALYMITGGYFDNAAASIPLLHTWSLSVEEQFYLIFPALMLLCWRLGRGRARMHVIRLVFVIVLTLSMIASLWFSYGHGLPLISKSQVFAFYSSPTRAWEFAAGAVLATTSTRLMERVSVRTASVLGLTGFALLAGGSIWITAAMRFPGLVAIIPVAACTLLIAAGSGAKNPVSSLLSRPPLVRIGDISYSWYLWHWPLIVLATYQWPTAPFVPLLAACLSVVPAWCSFRFLENPIRRASGDPRRSSWKLVTASVAVPVLLFAGLWEGALHSWGVDRIAQMAKQVEPEPIGYGAGCHSSVPLPARTLARCTWNRDATGQPVLLLGDSNAGQYAEAVIRAGVTTGHPVTLGTMPGCPFIDVEIRQNGFDSAACSAFVTRSLLWLQARPGSIIVMAAANEAIEDGGTELVDPTNGRHESTPQGKASLWRAGLQRTIHALESSGHQVVVVKTIPHFKKGNGYWTPAECTMWSLLNDTTRCGLEQSLASADLSQALPLVAEANATRKGGADLLNLRPIICAQGRCLTNIANDWIYRDGLHITTKESLALAPAFARAIARAPG